MILSGYFVPEDPRRFSVSEEADKSEKTKKPILWDDFVTITHEKWQNGSILYFVFCILSPHKEGPYKNTQKTQI